MKIENHHNSILDAYTRPVGDKQQAPQPGVQQEPQAVPKSDTVNLSSAAKELSRAKSQLEEVPDVREDKVAEIKKQIQDGTYQPDAQKIAGNMLRDSLFFDF